MGFRQVFQGIIHAQIPEIFVLQGGFPTPIGPSIAMYFGILFFSIFLKRIY